MAESTLVAWIKAIHLLLNKIVIGAFLTAATFVGLLEMPISDEAMTVVSRHGRDSRVAMSQLTNQLITVF